MPGAELRVEDAASVVGRRKKVENPAAVVRRYANVPVPAARKSRGCLTDERREEKRGDRRGADETIADRSHVFLPLLSPIVQDGYPACESTDADMEKPCQIGFRRRKDASGSVGGKPT
jgi:hypothetical protein